MAKQDHINNIERENGFEPVIAVSVIPMEGEKEDDPIFRDVWPGNKMTKKKGIVFALQVCLIVFLKAVFDYENFALDFTLLAITAVVMIFALIQYAKIFFDFLKEDKENKKKNS